jgi:hypothetical protein
MVSRPKDRGQLLVSGAVVIAITLIAVVSLCSTAISSGNANSRAATDAAETADMHRQIVEDDLAELAASGSGCSVPGSESIAAYVEQYNRIHGLSEPAVVDVVIENPDEIKETTFTFTYDSPQIHYQTELPCPN